METPLRLPASTSVVFDTNVLISTFVFPGFAADVYDFCVIHFGLYTSEWIVSELFNRKLDVKFKYSPERRSQIIDVIRERHTVVLPTNEMPTDCRDADDNNVIQASLFVNADFLITGDRDLLDLNRVGQTKIISPKAFFELYIV
ncbi:putative toxin-antitoxin system toxin component, PIN family [Spirosoma rhododendri]|uniref:Putative toxin-antitoxin system toxin component, PIN family n=1 Tax=Spirosoma rhododendri TaxID=2728024 RepID=A0A7L5DKP4_9BACT|nr:putative toxin-antitoxin system toxin component, PIN family [Spirosoma rhododendri]QJD78082.1 putative toxin-antitoxin system toxin component, PIN family [Spirosoma rhododendri]